MNPSLSSAKQEILAPPAPALTHRRGLNASLETIRQGLPAIAHLAIANEAYFLFRNGQVRRHVGHGHSHLERTVRRLARRADYASSRDYKRARRRDAEFEREILPELDRIRSVASALSAPSSAPLIFR